ncbi:uncharacterized protein LOC34621870 [Cyclospora cayetanensis]|uniref:Nucleolar protein 16 n=1 Tax=Cyclospora cayetanensis TaxID=88456 RepID=A0A6P6RVB4_9EIME|nr:uncharacterized protein LOC34621870 [Cyclospora cayetanensis]
MKRTRKTQYRPTTRRPKRARRGYVDVKRNLADKILREKWINSKSPAANLKRFTIGEFEDQLADDADLMMKTPEKKLNEMETKIISKLIEKYQDDYTKMGRDSRVNVYQWTARKCEKIAASFRRGHCCTSALRCLSHLLPQKRDLQERRQVNAAASEATPGAKGTATKGGSTSVVKAATAPAKSRKGKRVRSKVSPQ